MSGRVSVPCCHATPVNLNQKRGGLSTVPDKTADDELSRCHIQVFKTYDGKRQQGSSHANTPFYLVATTTANPGSRHQWFARAPVEINKLNLNANIQTGQNLINISVHTLCVKTFGKQYTLCHKSPSVLGFVASLPLHLIIKSIHV